MMQRGKQVLAWLLCAALVFALPPVALLAGEGGGLEVGLAGAPADDADESADVDESADADESADLDESVDADENVDEDANAAGDAERESLSRGDGLPITSMVPAGPGWAGPGALPPRSPARPRLCPPTGRRLPSTALISMRAT